MSSTCHSLRGTLAVTTIFLCLLSVVAAAQTPRILWNFPKSKSGLQYPQGAMVADKAGNLYGVAEAPGHGTIFRLSPPAPGSHRWTPTVLYTFHCQTDGCDVNSPIGDMIIDAQGNLYGTTSGYGAEPCQKTWCGSVFELSPPTTSGGSWTLTNLHSFIGPADGSSPNTALVMDKNGNLFGTTSSWGPQGGGTAFQLSPPATSGGTWTFNNIYSFSYGSSVFGSAAGVAMDKAGNLYGTTFYAGPSDCILAFNSVGCGNVFELLKPSTAGGSWTANILYQFTGGTDGAFPTDALVIDPEGNLFGTAPAGGNPSCPSARDTPGCGVAFEVSPPRTSNGAWIYSVIYSFGGSDTSYQPWTRLFRDSSGNLYGSSFDTQTFGDVFKLSPPASGSTWGKSVIGSFPAQTGSAYVPGAVIFLKGYGLIGTRWVGGPGAGEVFAVTP